VGILLRDLIGGCQSDNPTARNNHFVPCAHCNSTFGG
jgi:hypothetical protein